MIAAGKPLFIDKPMAGSLADVIEIFRLAKEAGVPCFSSSSLRTVISRTSYYCIGQKLYHILLHDKQLFLYP